MKSWQNPIQCSAAGSRPAGFASGASYEPKTSDPGATGMVQLWRSHQLHLGNISYLRLPILSSQAANKADPTLSNSSPLLAIFFQETAVFQLSGDSRRAVWDGLAQESRPGVDNLFCFFLIMLVMQYLIGGKKYKKLGWHLVYLSIRAAFKN